MEQTKPQELGAFLLCKEDKTALSWPTGEKEFTCECEAPKEIPSGLELGETSSVLAGGRHSKVMEQLLQR